MDKKMEDFILGILGDHRILTLATIREDGFPQANTVSYANDGLTVYFITDASSSKVKNIKDSNKVSLTVDRDYKDWSKIKGLSMGATAEILTSPEEIENAIGLLMQKFPALQEMPESEEPHAVVKIIPKIISVLNYKLGFAHTDLIEV
jgi:nitroimidazol reductase NimA-like FMN-containing flavoprotein (pyridoxamine 5'-phosphate oxidase superfamily)